MKLSIITINYNNAAGLKKTLDSVAMQIGTDFEHIIVDGASTDGSVEIIREYEQTLASDHLSLASNLTWISEPDKGIYNAMNKGIRMASGEYTLMLNSGDYFIINNVAEEVLPLLTGEDIIQGNVVVQRKDKFYVHRGYAHSDLSFLEIQYGDFPHQATFIRKDLLTKFGYYDESYRFISDTLFFLKTLGLNNASFKYIDKTFVFFAPGGASDQNVSERELERKRMYNENIPIRLHKFCIENEKKIILYDTLHANKLIWYVTLILSKIGARLSNNVQKFRADKCTEYKGYIR